MASDAKKRQESPSDANVVSNGVQCSALTVAASPRVDTGWSWVVLFTNFLARLVQGGLFWSMNFYFVVFREEFGESRTYTSLIGALALATYLSASPLASFTIKKFDERKTALLGSLLVTTSYLANINANGVFYLIITNVIFFGIGFCFLSNALLASLNQYFRRYMYIATGVSMAGAGVGTFLFALLVPFLLDTFGWRGSMFLLAGFSLQLCIVGAVLFPNNSIDPPNPLMMTKRKTVGCCSVASPLLHSKLFWFLNFSQFFFCIGQVSIIVLFKDFANSRGLGDSYSWAQGALGIGDIVGRVLSGILANHPCVNAVVLYCVIDLFCAAVVLGLVIAHAAVSLVACSLMLGFGLGCQVSLLCIAPNAIFGREKYVVALGYAQTMAGVGALLGPPISSSLADFTGSYTWTLVLIAITNTIGAALLFTIYIVQRRTTKSDLEMNEI